MPDDPVTTADATVPVHVPVIVGGGGGGVGVLLPPHPANTIMADKTSAIPIDFILFSLLIECI